MKKSPPKTELSIVIVTYNNESQLPACLVSLYKFNRAYFQKGEWEVVVFDNNSADKTVEHLKTKIKNYPGLILTTSYENTGFAVGNNRAVEKSKGQFILFLNPDTVVEAGTLTTVLLYLKNHPEVGAASAKTLLADGKLDRDCHRGFPTPWNAFCHFSGMEKIFPKSRLFAGYTLGNLDLATSHEVDAINGAFFMLPASLGKKLGFFDEKFFWKGEDLDLCYRIKQAGYKIMFLPGATVHHHKGSSRGHVIGSKTLSARFAVMEQFYKNHYQKKYPKLILLATLFGIKLLKAAIYLKIYLSSLAARLKL